MYKESKIPRELFVALLFSQLSTTTNKPAAAAPMTARRPTHAHAFDVINTNKTEAAATAAKAEKARI